MYASLLEAGTGAVSMLRSVHDMHVCTTACSHEEREWSYLGVDLCLADWVNTRYACLYYCM